MINMRGTISCKCPSHTLEVYHMDSACAVPTNPSRETGMLLEAQLVTVPLQGECTFSIISAAPVCNSRTLDDATTLSSFFFLLPSLIMVYIFQATLWRHVKCFGSSCLRFLFSSCIFFKMAYNSERILDIRVELLSGGLRVRKQTSSPSKTMTDSPDGYGYFFGCSQQISAKKVLRICIYIKI